MSHIDDYWVITEASVQLAHLAHVLLVVKRCWKTNVWFSGKMEDPPHRVCTAYNNLEGDNATENKDW